MCRVQLSIVRKETCSLLFSFPYMSIFVSGLVRALARDAWSQKRRFYYMIFIAVVDCVGICVGGDAAAFAIKKEVR